MNSNKGTIGIIGLGKYGLYLAEELAKQGKSLLCIDKNESKVKKVSNICETCFVCEDLSQKSLEEMGFKECETIIVCISEQLDVAILATLNCINLNINKVIALSNSEEQGFVLEKLGAEVIYPYKDSVNYLVKKISNNNFLDFIALSDTVEILEIKVPRAYVGKKIVDTEIRQKFGLNIIAIDKKNQIITSIDPNYVFEKDDAIVVIGSKDDLIKFQKIK